MKIHLNQAEIFEAVQQYIEGQGISLAHRNIDISMKAGRGDRGHYADVHIRRDKSDPTDPFVEEDLDDEPDSDDNAINFD
jgi:hypothetical protein